MAISTTTQNRLVWGVRILLALVFAAAGTAKLAGVPQMVATFDGIGIGQWFRYLTGVIEVGGALLLLLPATSLIAGLMLGATMVGAVAAHLFFIPGSAVPAVVLGALCAVVVYHQRPARLKQA